MRNDAEPAAPTWWRAALALVMLVPVVVTVHRLLSAGLWADEYYTVLARRMILESGVPRLPSGVLYPYGGPALYLGAVGTWIGGLDVFWNRLPLALPALLAPLVLASTGRRLFGPVAGLTAAAVVALNPGYLQWTASAGVYGVLTLLSALAIDRWCAWVIEEQDDAALPFALWFALAALCHPVVAALLPGLLLAALIRRREPHALDRSRVLACSLCVLAPALVVGLIALGDRTLLVQLPAEDRAGAGLLYQIGSRGWRVLDGLQMNLFASPWHAVAAWLAAVGAVAACFGTGRLRERVRTPPGEGLLLLLPVLVAVALLSGLFRYRWHRYLLPALPLIALGAGRMFSLLVSRADGRLARAAGVLAVATLAAHAAISWHALPAVVSTSAGRARVLAHLGAEVQPDDLALGGGVPVALHAGLHVRRHPVWSGSYELNAHMLDGTLRDRFLGDTVLTDLASVRAAFESADRIWYVVTDDELERGRVSAEVHEWLSERTEPIASEEGLHLRRR